MRTRPESRKRVRDSLGGLLDQADPGYFRTAPVFPNRARKEAALPSLTVGVRKTKVLTHSPPDGSRLNCHGPKSSVKEMGGLPSP